MAISRRLAEDRSAQVELPDDAARRKVEHLGHDFGDLVVRQLARALRIDQDGHRLRDADGVGQLDLAAFREACRHHVLRGVSGRVGSASVHLRGVLARESAAAVAGVAAVGVDDYLAAGQTGVAVWSADDEAAGRVDVVFRLAVQELLRNDGLDDVLDQILLDLLLGHVGVVLRGDQDGIHAHGLIVFVFDGHLGLAVRTQVGQHAVLADLRQLHRQLVSQRDGQRHEFRGLRAGVAEHDALVAGAADFLVRAHGDVRGLLVHRDDDAGAERIEAVFALRVADVGDHLAGDALDVDVAGRGHFAHDHHEAGRRAGLAGDSAQLVLAQRFVEHGVGDLVADLIGVAFRDGFGSKQFSYNGYLLLCFIRAHIL